AGAGMPETHLESPAAMPPPSGEYTPPVPPVAIERFCACPGSANADVKSATARVKNRMDSSSACAAILPHAESAQRRRAALLRCALHFRVKAAAVAVHRHQQRAEVPNAKLPERVRIEVIEVHVLDRSDPGRLQRRGAADAGEVGAARVAEGSDRFVAQAALADHQ